VPLSASDNSEGPGPGPDLSVEDLVMRFGGIAAVDKVSFKAHPGERVALLGPNGAGKTTLFNMITGDLRPTAGRIRMFGEDVTRLASSGRVRKGMRRTYQTSSLFDEMSVAQNLYLGMLGPGGMHHYNMASSAYRGEIWPRAAKVARDVGLSRRFFARASELSHGERRQLEIGVSLCLKPRIILLDEPAAGLSPEERTTLTQLIEQLPSTITILIIEHDMDIALRVAQRVIVMSDGHVVAEGTPASIVANEVVQAVYLGQSRRKHEPC
jgi:branched-chain amino acid transport system ATP-binding protein